MNGNPRLIEIETYVYHVTRTYLKDEHSDKKAGAQFDLSNWNCLHVKDIPQQMNGSDCGMFTCKFAEYLSRGKLTFNFNQVLFFRLTEIQARNECAK